MKVSRSLLAALLMCASAVASSFEAVQMQSAPSPGALAAAWADYDGDDDLDLLVTFVSGEVRLYRNDHGTFVSVGAALGLPVKGDPVRGASWGDYDGDGYPDLYTGTMASPIPGRNYLYRNERGQRFVDVAQELGVAVPGVSSRQANWIDYDNDGDLDLFVANRIGENRLFRNDGERFTDVSKQVRLADVRRTVGACWFDFDSDGDLDLFLANQEGDKDALYRNDGAAFVDVAPELGMDRPQRRLAEGGVGCSVGDFDNDGDLDLFVAAYGTSLLYRNEGSGRFAEVARAMGATIAGHMVGASWGDYDNDGRLDLYVAGYERDAQGLQLRDYLLRNRIEGFTNVLTPDHALFRADHGVQWVDFDGDGALDVVLTDGRARGDLTVLRNTMPRADRSRSIQVLVADRNGKYTRAGSEVRFHDTSGNLLGTRLVATGDGYNSQGVQPVHFGLPKAMRATVEVIYLTPQGRQSQRVENVDARALAGKPLIVRQR